MSGCASIEPIADGIVALFEAHAGEDGKLDRSELKKLLDSQISNPEHRAKLTDNVLDKIMDRADQNQDGKLSFTEFGRCLMFIAKHRNKRFLLQ
ncbi:unnamed protein product [Ophioblennius macclurei]